MGTAEASQAHLGKKELTTLHAIGQSLALGPIFSAALSSAASRSRSGGGSCRWS
jgi:hypothetical protein